MWATPSVELGSWTNKKGERKLNLSIRSLSASWHRCHVTSSSLLPPSCLSHCDGLCKNQNKPYSLKLLLFLPRVFCQATGKVANMTPRSGCILRLSLAIFCSATSPSYVFFSSAVSQGSSPWLSPTGHGLAWFEGGPWSSADSYVPSDFTCHRWVVAGRVCACLL